MLLEVGQVVRPHGVRGEVVVTLVTDRAERLAPGSVLTTDRGPLEVERARPHKGRWIVAFAGVADADAAEALRGVVLRAEPIADPGVIWVHELIGSTVVDTTGATLGTVTAVEANPASDLLVLDGGGLLPLTFVVEHDPGRVVADPPAGLFEL